MKVGRTALRQVQPLKDRMDFFQPIEGFNRSWVLHQAARFRACSECSGKRGRASPQEACALFRTFLASETKMIKRVEEQGARCGIPADVPKQMKAGHAKAAEIAKKVCEAAAHPPRPAGPTFSDVFGTPTVPENKPKSGGGTFDTLTGNALSR